MSVERKLESIAVVLGEVLAFQEAICDVLVAKGICTNGEFEERHKAILAKLPAEMRLPEVMP